jgi:hypothetical protein
MLVEWNTPLVPYTPVTAKELDKDLDNKASGRRTGRKTHITALGVTKGVWFLKALNKSLWPYPFTGLERSPAPPPLNFHLRVKDPDTNKVLTDLFASDLRAMVDQWIDSGRTGNREAPDQRHLTGMLRQTLREWAAVNQPDLVIDDDSGELTLLMPAFKLDSVGGRLATPSEVVKQEAVRVFVEFYDSAYRHKLFRCVSCEKYWFSERPKEPTEYGTYCQESRCQKAFGEERERLSRANSERARMRNLILDLAARALAECYESHRSEQEKKKDVMGKVNAVLRKKRRHLSWVLNKTNILTAHWSEIQAKALAVIKTRPSHKPL